MVSGKISHLAVRILFVEGSKGKEMVILSKQFTTVSLPETLPRQESESVRRSPEEGQAVQEPAASAEGETEQREVVAEKSPSPVVGEKLPTGAPPLSRGLLPEMGPLPQTTLGASAGAPPSPPFQPNSSNTSSSLSMKGEPQSSKSVSKSTPSFKAGDLSAERRQLSQAVARLAEPLTPQERAVLLAMVKQACERLQTLPAKEIFQKIITPGEVLSPAIRGFVEKISLWELLLQKFSSNPSLPIRKELLEIKEIGTKVLLMANKEKVREEFEELLQGPLKSRLESLERIISSLPQKEETEIEQLLNRLVELPEVAESALPREVRAEKVPYPISLQFATQVRTREELAFAVRALESGAKKDSSTSLVLIPLPWEKKGEGAQAGGSKSIEKEKRGVQSEGQAGQQAMVYIPPGKVFLGEPEQQKAALQLEGFFLGVVPITNLFVATWLNGLASEGRINVKSGKVFFDRHLLLLRTKEATFESQIETRVVGNTLYFGVEKGAEEHPIVHISYKGAELFCSDMSLRLPTEAEWERAAGMQGDKEKFRFGFSRNILDSTWANYDRGKGRAGTNCTTPVGFYNGLHLFAHQGKSLVTKNAVSPWGCYDMSGNVYEWTQDSIVKGGSYLSPAQELHVAAGRLLDPYETYPDVGFRVCLSL